MQAKRKAGEAQQLCYLVFHGCTRIKPTERNIR